MTRTSRTTRLLATVALVASLAACSGSGSDGDGDTPTGTPTPELPRPRITTTAFGPTCDSLFVEGTAMQEVAQDGCLDADRGRIAESTTQDCADGRVLVANEFAFGIVDGPVTLTEGRGSDPTTTPGYDEVLAECQG